MDGLVKFTLKHKIGLTIIFVRVVWVSGTLPCNLQTWVGCAFLMSDRNRKSIMRFLRNFIHVFPMRNPLLNKIPYPWVLCPLSDDQPCKMDSKLGQITV